MGVTGAGAARGALAGAALVLALVTLPALLAGGAEAAVAPLTLLVAAVGALLGSLCGAAAGRVLDDGGTWQTAALVSGIGALVLVLGVVRLVGGTALLTTLGTVMGAGAVLLATWQSWALQRRQDRAARPH